MSPADVALSKGLAPQPLDPKRVVRDAFGRPVAYWTAGTVRK